MDKRAGAKEQTSQTCYERTDGGGGVGLLALLPQGRADLKKRRGRKKVVRNSLDWAGRVWGAGLNEGGYWKLRVEYFHAKWHYAGLKGDRATVTGTETQ